VDAAGRLPLACHRWLPPLEPWQPR
jgi:hypothetical protein